MTSQAISSRALSLAAGRAANAWQGEGTYQLKSIRHGILHDATGWYGSIDALIRDAYIVAMDVANSHDIFADFAVESY